MNGGITLRGMAWDHPRARNPLESISASWSKERDVNVRWDARPLKDFEDQPLEELATAYDLVLIDYPFVGIAAASGLIVPVNEWTDNDYRADQAAHSVGPSYASYTWNNQQWALAIDAACQVSARRADLWRDGGFDQPPAHWDEVAELAAQRCAAPARVAMPLNANHSYCAFLSVGVTLAGAKFWPENGRVERDAGVESLQFLRRLAGDLHPASRHSDPIAISDLMCGSNEIIYVPLMFGYSNYARPGFCAETLKFGDVPKGTGGDYGTVLGGVGIALSALSPYRETAADLARHLVSPAVQSGPYVDAGGQPGHGSAWESSRANKQVGNFFLDTRQSIEHAFVRPRVPGHRSFQQMAGELIHRFIWEGGLTPQACLAEYDHLIDTLLEEDVTATGETHAS